MTFAAIARELGVSKTAVRQSYENAMRKIRRDKKLMEQLRGWLRLKEQLSPKPTVWPDMND